TSRMRYKSQTSWSVQKDNSRHQWHTKLLLIIFKPTSLTCFPELVNIMAHRNMQKNHRYFVLKKILIYLLAI
ncbi:mCG122811, isoform CRA_a, partial [Mus musculus]